jgi:antitoxin component YwqK of YwqJK toxin-antitoxin module
MDPKKPKNHIEYHNDGSIWAKGKILGNVPTGFWEWFRKDGTRMRSGFFENGKQIGEWITYDRQGKKVKVTLMKDQSKSKISSKKS